jgi:outer membrane receptor protein involved in Fe transport
MRKSAWLLSAGLFALTVPAHAQETDTDGPTAQPTQGATAEAAAVDDTAKEQQSIDTSDIVVTATRRNEALSDVPLAVSAVTAQSLEYSGATDIRQLQQLSPSLLVSSTQSEASGAVARIRGIGTVGDNPGLESSVGVFIDGVYRSRTGVGLSELGALDRIEVLRGPQGTLFGRNTSAGLISIITAKPLFRNEFSGQLDIGNFDYRRAEFSATGPVNDALALRLDGVYVTRDGFEEDVISGRDVNDRNRYLLRGQALYKPTDVLSVRLVADYSRRREECCAAPYLPAFDRVGVNGEIVEEPSTIAAIERGLGAVINDDTYDRDVSITPGRDYDSNVDDGGVSGEVVYDFGGAELTSITAYRINKAVRGQDADFNNLDILFRDSGGGSSNKFNTFSQELRLQGTALNDRLDWLVGGYFANEVLKVKDNLSYGDDYGAYANCLVANSFAASPLVPDSIVSAGTSPTCFNTAVATGTRNALLGLFQQAVAGGDLATASALGNQITVLGAFAGLDNSMFTPAPINFTLPGFGTSGFQNLATANGFPGLGFGGQTDDRYRQTSRNFAIFTHNIFKITDDLNLTVGARYTTERKKLNASFSDTGTLCGFYSLAAPDLQQIPCVIPSVPGGAFSDSAKKTEHKLTGTVVLSYKPTPDLLTYASYSRGYKAGGFNLDRSALLRAGGNGAVLPSATVDALAFKPEINDAIEAGIKYNGRGLDINVAVFQELFSNFQLNTFNGLNFIVENINSCNKSLGGTDSDASPVTGACTGGTRAGVKSQGVEVEVFTRPVRNVSLNFGVVYADTRYRTDLVGSNGQPLTPALFQLPGRRLSNAPEWTGTGSFAWTPPIGSSGLRGLIYFDGRYMTRFNTGSDLDIEKTQDDFATFNGRIGIHGPDNAWGLELFAQNLFDAHFEQVGFDAPLQGSCTSRGALNGLCVPPIASTGIPNRSTALFGAFLGEPRTFGLTLRAKFGASRPAPVYAPPPPPPPVPAPATQTCADGTVILATGTCALPPPPPPPPPPVSGERG